MVTGYELDEVLGVGAHATVWRARRRGPVPLDVAVKRVADGVGGRARIRSEAAVLAACDHPNLIRLIDVVADGDDRDGGDDEGGDDAGTDHLALVLALVRGGSLAAAVRGGEMAAATLVGHLVDVAAALGALHRVGVVHGDVKPSNILLAADGGTVLADLGSAGPTAGAAVGGGSDGFAAPELVARGILHPHLDVFGLGACAVAALTGSPPGPGGGAGRLTDIGVSRQLAATVATALHADPDERFPTADALRAALLACPEADPRRWAG
jgi:serine/threonine protein kinase